LTTYPFQFPYRSPKLTLFRAKLSLQTIYGDHPASSQLAPGSFPEGKVAVMRR